MLFYYWNCRHPKLRWRQFSIGYLLPLQFRNDFFEMVFGTVKVG